MAEIMRNPVVLTIDDIGYIAFDDKHTWSDFVRWLMKNPIDAEEVHYLLGEAIKQSER